MYWWQEVPVNTAKTASAGAAVASTMLFASNPALGLMMGIGSGVVGVGTSVCNNNQTKANKSRLIYKISEADATGRELREI